VYGQFNVWLWGIMGLFLLVLVVLIGGGYMWERSRKRKSDAFWEKIKQEDRKKGGK